MPAVEDHVMLWSVLRPSPKVSLVSTLPVVAAAASSAMVPVLASAVGKSSVPVMVMVRLDVATLPSLSVSV